MSFLFWSLSKINEPFEVYFDFVLLLGDACCNSEKRDSVKREVQNEQTYSIYHQSQINA